MHGSCNFVEFVCAPSINMPRLSLHDKACAIGQLEAGVPVRRVAALFGVSPGTTSKLRTKFRETGEVKDRPVKWQSQEDNTPRRPVPHPCFTEEQ